MAIYAIGDLHLSFGVDKPMDIFGGVWTGYTEKIEHSLAQLTEKDVLLLLGDFSWGLSLEQAAPDFAFLERVCPAKKILLKGNHDYWWGTVGKMTDFLLKKGWTDITFLHNNCYRFGQAAFCGTRGWFLENEKPEDPQNTKVFLREMGRLETSLRAGRASGAEILIACLHYPPLYEGYRCDRVLELFHQYGVSRCLYGHLHGAGISRAIHGIWEGVQYDLLSADAVSFQPVKIFEE